MYRVVHSNNFNQQLIKLYSSHPRIDELKQAIEWLLNRTPRFGILIEGDYYLWVTEQLPIKTVPKVKIFYLVDDDAREVKLLSIAKHVDQP